jgi:DNA-binding beta-propeller fold protein YncE
MALAHVGDIDLPSHVTRGGFDHAAVHAGHSRLYVAHTANDAVDVVDGTTDRYLGSIPALREVAGVVVSEARDLLSMVDVGSETVIAEVPAPGRTRWAVFNGAAEAFYVNIMDPPQICVLEAQEPRRIGRTMTIPVAGPHGLDLDPSTGRLFCACDGRALVAVEARSGRLVDRADLSGVPDVVFVNPALGHVYVAIGDPGMIEVFETDPLRRPQTVSTERGAHTLAFDPPRHRLYAFLPERHAAAIYVDGER